MSEEERGGEGEEERGAERRSTVRDLRALWEGMQTRAEEAREATRTTARGGMRRLAEVLQERVEQAGLDDDDSDDDDSDDDEEAGEAEANAGQVFITEMLEAYPAEKTNSNKIIVPPSLLTELSDKKVWENRPAGKPIIFKLEVADPETQDVIETTFAGVEEFTAPAGKIGLPHKTALSLTKERGVGWLQKNPMVYLSYVDLPSFEQSFMQIQPRGKGFHLDSEAVVNLDIKAILEKTLRDHIVLTRGDWIPIFHEGNWYELVVRDTRPDETLEVLNTDLEVDILPSEDTELEQTALQEAKDKLKQFMDARRERAKAKEQKLSQEKEPEKGDKSSILVRIRLPNGKSKTRRFEIGSLFGLVMDWAEYEMYKAEFIPAELPETKPEDYWFKIVEKIPRKAARNLTGEDAWKPLKQIMSEGEGVRSGISLIVEVLKNKSGQKDGQAEGGDGEGAGEEEGDNAWNKAFTNLQRRIEAGEFEAEPEPEISQGEIDALAERLMEYGLTEEVARENAAKYPRQLMQLESMGYVDKMEEALTVLDRTRGGINQTIDALLQSSTNETTNEEDGEEEETQEEEQEEDGEPEVAQHVVEALIERLKVYGVTEDVAIESANRYPKQLLQLESMGYVEKMTQIIALLGSKKGNLNQTIDGILHGALEETLTDYDSEEEEQQQQQQELEEDEESEDEETGNKD